MFNSESVSLTSKIFLPQDGYKEHHSAIVHCRFSSSGRMIGSADADGIVK